MIKFFRKIRFNLMKTGKTGKYLKYAIGEVLLIMIGIFMALQLQNWNQKRQQELQFKATLEQLYTTIKYDSEAFFRQSKNFEFDAKEIDSLLDFPDNYQEENLPYILFSLTYDVEAHSSESAYYLEDLTYNPKDQQQKELAKEVLNYINRITNYTDKVDNSLKEMLQAADIAHPKVHFQDGQTGWDDSDQSYYSDEDFKKLKEMLHSKKLRTVLKSVRTTKVYNNYDALNRHTDGLSIREMIKDYYPEVKVIYKDVGIIGTSIDGFDDVGAKSTPMILTDEIENIWEVTLQLKVGRVKFRCRDSWAQNWGVRGQEVFPEGKAVHDGRDINIPEAGNYRVILNLTDNQYRFQKLDD